MLASRTQYDWLFLFRLRSAMFALWTSEDVLDEAHRVWRRRFPTAGGDMRRNRDRLFRRVFDEVLDSWVGGKVAMIVDEDDPHVHNAAAAAGAEILLTNNVRDFGDASARPYDLYTPDEFFTLVAASGPDAAREVTREQVLYWMKRRESSSGTLTLADALRGAGCRGFADVVEGYVRVLGGLHQNDGERTVSGTR